jgi:glycogen(starch) synthase
MRRNAEGLRVMLTADAVGGVWTYAQDLAAGLAKTGAGVTLAVLGPAPPERPALPPGVDLVVTDLPLDWGDVDPPTLDRAGRVLADLARQTSADLVHLNSPILAASAPFDRPVVGGCHSCLATWWDAVRGDEPMPQAFQWRTERLRDAYAACAALIAPTWDFAEQTRRRYGVKPSVVWNGRAGGFSPLGDEQRRRVAVTTGRLWDAAKGAAVLDAAAGLARRRVEAAGAVRGPSGDAAAAFAHLHLWGRLGPADVADLLSASEVFVSAARYEPFGLSVLEAAQAGCALVLSDLPVFRELWDGAATFVDATDPAAFAGAIDTLLQDPAHARERGGRARARAERFTADAMVEGTLAVYFQALSHAAPANGVAA